MSIQAQSHARETQLVLLLDDDAMITEGLAAGLERRGRTIITCNDVESAELIVERMRPSHIVADVRISGPFGYEGLDFIRFAKRHTPESRIVLISGEGAEALQFEASERGAVAFLQKPFEVAELDSTLDMLHSSVLSHTSADDRTIRMPLLDQVLASGGLYPLFQPIVRLAGQRSILGFEALSRYSSDSPLRHPEVLFRYAARKDRVADLELACIKRALATSGDLPGTGLLFLNVHPDVFARGGELRDALIAAADEAHVGLDRISASRSDQGSLVSTPLMLKTIGDLKSHGVRFAFDDVGVAYSHLPLMDAVAPAFLKVSQHFGTGFEQDATRTKIVANLLSLAKAFGCDLILEGVEDESTADAAAALGIPLAQGFHFGRPEDPPVP